MANSKVRISKVLENWKSFVQEDHWGHRLAAEPKLWELDRKYRTSGQQMQMSLLEVFRDHRSIESSLPIVNGDPSISIVNRVPGTCSIVLSAKLSESNSLLKEDAIMEPWSQG